MPITTPTDVHSTTGLKDVVIAKMLTDTETVGATAGATTYDTPAKLVGALNVELSPDSGDPDEQWVDDHLNDVLIPTPRIKFTAEMADIPPETRALINTHTTDTNGVVVAKGDDAVTYFALGFKSQKQNGSTRYEWLYKGYAKLIGSKSETIGKDGRKRQTTKIEFTFVPRTSDNVYHVFVDDDTPAFSTAKATFFTTVYAPVYTAG